MSVVCFHTSVIQDYPLPLGNKEKISSKIGEFSFSSQGNKKYYPVITHYQRKSPPNLGNENG